MRYATSHDKENCLRSAFVDPTILIPVFVASLVLSTTLQWVADSGDPPKLDRVVIKGAVGIMSYALAVLLLGRGSWAKWKLLIFVAIAGTMIFFVLSTLVETWYSYRNEYTRGFASMGEWSKTWLVTLIGREVLSPLFIVFFLTIAFPLHGLMLLINRIFTDK
jgi:uncharacterized protein YacL